MLRCEGVSGVSGETILVALSGFNVRPAAGRFFEMGER